MNATDRKLERYRAALERLGSMLAFDLPRAMNPGQDRELLLRINYAQQELAAILQIKDECNPPHSTNTVGSASTAFRSAS